MDPRSCSDKNDRNSVPMRGDLLRMVDEDNAKFLREKKQARLSGKMQRQANQRKMAEARGLRLRLLKNFL